MIVVSDQLSVMQLHAYIDGQLDDEGMERVEEYLDTHPEKLTELHNYEVLGQGLRQRYNVILEQTIPIDMLVVMGAKQSLVERLRLSELFKYTLAILALLFERSRIPRLLANDKVRKSVSFLQRIARKVITLTRLDRLGLGEWFSDLVYGVSMMLPEWKKRINKFSVRSRHLLYAAYVTVSAFLDKVLAVCGLSPEKIRGHWESLSFFGSRSTRVDNRNDSKGRHSFWMLAIWASIGAALGWFVHLQSVPDPLLITQQHIDDSAIEAHQYYTKEGIDAVKAGGESNNERIMQKLSSIIGHPVKTAYLGNLGFEIQGVLLLPSIKRSAAYRLYQNKQQHHISLYINKDHQGVENSNVTCRMPKEVDSLCTWVSDFVRYTTDSELSLSRVRNFSRLSREQMTK